MRRIRAERQRRVSQLGNDISEVLLSLLDQLLRLEVLSQVEHLPGGQTQQAAHGEDGEVEHARIGGLVGVSHLLLALAHVREVLHDAFAEVLQPLQLHLEGLELGGVAQAVVALGLDAVLGVEENLVALASLLRGDPGQEADFEDVVVVGGEGELALVGGFAIHEMLKSKESS